MQATWYVVWCEAQGSPTAKHLDAQEAIAEAKRLAKLHPGREYHVLRLMGTARKTDVEYIDATDEIPF